MGQYYRPVIEKNNKPIAIDTYLNGEYECAKLMEQSWYTAEYVNAVSELLYNKPRQIAWVGDYAISVADKFPNVPVELLFETAYGDNSTPIQSLKTTDFSLGDKYLVNHDTAEFINLNKYYQENLASDGYCTHPVSLLTAIGNGQGGGDFLYHAQSEEQVNNVGKWAWNTLEITDTEPKGYKEVMYHFIED